MPKKASHKTTKKLTNLPVKNFNEIFQDSVRKTFAPLRGAKLPPQVRQLPLAKDLTFGAVALLLFLVLGSLALFFFGNQLVRAWQERTAAAVVNGETIPKGQLERRLLQSYGEDTIQRIIDETLVLQEGRKQKVNITEDKIAAEISEIEQQIAPEKLEDALAARKLTRSDLEHQIQIQIITEDILGREFQITEEQISEYFNQNKEPLAQAANKTPEELRLEDVRDGVIDQIRQREIANRYRGWIEELRANSNIVTFVTP